MQPVNPHLPVPESDAEGAEERGTLPEETGLTQAEASRVDEVYLQVLSRIVRGELRGGTQLKSTQLARELGVSRTPVMQALNRLAADGLIQLELNKRAIVRQGAENWLVEIHQVRELLEPQAAELATARLTDEQLEQLKQLAEDARPYVTPEWQDAARRFDYALHLTIAESSGSLALEAAIKKCWSYKRLSYEAATDLPEMVVRGYQEHLSILEGLVARDAQTASVAMRFHLLSAARLRPAKTIV